MNEKFGVQFWDILNISLTLKRSSKLSGKKASDSKASCGQRLPCPAFLKVSYSFWLVALIGDKVL